MCTLKFYCGKLATGYILLQFSCFKVAVQPSRLHANCIFLTVNLFFSGNSSWYCFETLRMLCLNISFVVLQEAVVSRNHF